MRRVGAALALAAASVAAWGSPALADVPGFSLTLDRTPGTMTIGKAPEPLTAVVSTDRGRRCQKVRWVLVVRTEGISLDQLRVQRIENGQEFRTRAQLLEDGARLTDADVDPGELCRGRTVTGQWTIAFAGPDDGTATLEAQALDVTGRVLSSASTTSRVVSPVAATTRPAPSSRPSPSRSATFTPEPEKTRTQEAADDGPAAGETSGGAVALNRTSNTPTLLGPGLIVGAVLVFLGVGLLLRLRTRNHRAAAEAQALPTGFYSMPRKRSS